MAAAQTQCGDEWDDTQQSAEKRQLSEGQRKGSVTVTTTPLQYSLEMESKNDEGARNQGKPLNKGRFM